MFRRWVSCCECMEELCFNMRKQCQVMLVGYILKQKVSLSFRQGEDSDGFETRNIAAFCRKISVLVPTLA